MMYMDLSVYRCFDPEEVMRTSPGEGFYRFFAPIVDVVFVDENKTLTM